MDIAEFVKARLDEDEAAANEVHRPGDCGCVDRDGSFSPDPVWCGCGYPDRVRREVAAKRAILALYDNPEGYAYNVALERVVVQLATAYSDHPDYRAEWKP